MPGETVPLKEHFEALLAEAEKRNGQRFDAQQLAVKTAMDSAEKAVTNAMAAAEKAVAKAEIAADKRLDGLNELRQMALDWKTEFARQTTVDLQIKGVSDKVDALQGTSAGGRNETIARIVQLVVTVGGIVGIIGAVLATRAH